MLEVPACVPTLSHCPEKLPVHPGGLFRSQVCPVTAPGIWAFSPEKSVFPGFLRGAHPAPVGAHRRGGGQMGLRALGGLHALGGSACIRPCHLRPPAALCPLAPARECVLVWECPGKDTCPFALSAYCRADVDEMFLKHRVTLVHWVIRPLGPHVLRAPP